MIVKSVLNKRGTILTTKRNFLTPLASRDIFGIWANYVKGYMTPTVANYIDFYTRRSQSYTGDFKKGIELDSHFEQEAQIMGYNAMPRELELIQSFLSNIEDYELKMEGFKYLSILVAPLESVKPSEIPRMLESLKLKTTIQEHLYRYSNIMKSNLISTKKTGRGHFAGEEEAQVAYKQTSTPSSGKQSTKGKKPTPTSSSPTIAVAKWHNVRDNLFCSKATPWDFKKEMTTNDNIYICFDEKEPIYRYTATTAACAKCDSAYKNRTNDFHAPRCYGKQCVKCDLFGHVTRTCLQA
jgi:hypothetical protein